MLSFVLRRTATGILLLFVVASAAYLLLGLGTGDIARTILGPGATQAQVAALSTQLGIDQPLFSRYLAWLSGAVSGDFGVSWYTRQPVAEAITSRLGVTLSLVIGSTVLTAVVATVLGVFAARRRGVFDRLVQVLSVFGFALPSFLIAVFLVNIFALNLGWFSSTGFVPITSSFTGWLATVTLPLIALSINSIASISAQVRGAVIDAMRQDWVRTLRSRGLSENRILFRHVLRNAAGPALAVLGVNMVSILGGAVIVESIFAIPGLGQISLTGTTQGDIPLVMGLVVAVAVIVVIVNVVIEIVHGLLNPKARIA